MDEREIRLRLIEAASRMPQSHKDGYAAGVLEMAAKWEQYVLPPAAKPLGLPKKGA
jgi:hypothetical protein